MREGWEDFFRIDSEFDGEDDWWQLIDLQKDRMIREFSWEFEAIEHAKRLYNDMKREAEEVLLS